MHLNLRFDAGVDEIRVRVLDPIDEGDTVEDSDRTVIHLSTVPTTWHRWFVNEPPPFGTGQVGPFDTLSKAFDYMRSRGYKLKEDVVREQLAEAGEL